MMYTLICVLFWTFLQINGQESAILQLSALNNQNELIKVEGDSILETNFDPVVTNGQNATAGQFPYQAYLQISSAKGNYFCGGSLITVNYVLTAAHCLPKCDAGSIIIVGLGALRIHEYEPDAQYIAAESWKSHERYTEMNPANDIGVIKLEKPAVLNSFVKLVKLGRPITYTSYVGIISGWGLTQDGATEQPNNMQFAKTRIISNALCRVTYRNYITPNTICTSGAGGISTCFGDSGGALVAERTGEQVGINAFVHAKGCAKGYPAGYTRVSRYLTWIRRNSDWKR